MLTSKETRTALAMAASKDSFEVATTVADQPEEYFTTIPGELRNRIYELAFASEKDTRDSGTEVELMSRGSCHFRQGDMLYANLRDRLQDELSKYKRTSPWIGLLLSCKQIHNEAINVFHEGYRTDYWTNNSFILHTNEWNFTLFWDIRKEAQKMTAAIGHENVALITSVEISRNAYMGGFCGWKLRNGVWTSFEDNYQPSGFDGILPACGQSLVMVSETYEEHPDAFIATRPFFLRNMAPYWGEDSLPRVVEVTGMDSEKQKATMEKVGRTHLTEREITAFIVRIFDYF